MKRKITPATPLPWGTTSVRRSGKGLDSKFALALGASLHTWMRYGVYQHEQSFQRTNGRLRRSKRQAFRRPPLRPTRSQSGEAWVAKAIKATGPHYGCVNFVENRQCVCLRASTKFPAPRAMSNSSILACVARYQGQLERIESYYCLNEADRSTRAM